MSSYTIPTVQQIALRMLRYIGVTQFTAQAATSELESLGPGDLEDVANAITGALQEIAAIGPSEAREAPGYAVLNAPAQVTLNLTAQSNVIGAITGWQSWMQGCTLRIAGDDQDNEILSQTNLARAYMGNTASSIAATVYGDTINLDDTIGRVIAPLWLPNQLPLWPSKDRLEFLRLGGYPLVTDPQGYAMGVPFYLYYRKPIQRPWTWFIDAAYDQSLGYTQRRIRFSPMPDQAYSVAYIAGMNPPRVTKDDIVSPVDGVTDPGTVLPIPNGWVESILLPIALVRFSGTPAFKNSAALPEINRQYKTALQTLKDSKGQETLQRARYL